MTAEHITVNQPRHPLPALTTYELAGYRHDLEKAIAYSDSQNPVPPVRADLQTRLDAVIAEQDDRTRIAHA